jgi:stage V sporulation protein R
MPRSLTPRLAQLKDEIEGYAQGLGLDFFETVFEMLGYDELNMVASYGGFPNRYPHWRWGMEYEQLSKGTSTALQDLRAGHQQRPCYAYLLESNAEVDQKLVMAHVYAHCDFFKNNFYFQHTNRRMMDEMANHATRIRRWVDKVGIEKVEDFIDRALSLENLIDYHAPFIRAPRPEAGRAGGEEQRAGGGLPRRPRVHARLREPHRVPRVAAEEGRGREGRRSTSPSGRSAMLLFLLEHARSSRGSSTCWPSSARRPIILHHRVKLK